ncbi:SUR2 [Auxenochlorella protothecoides x Auxenochlorella symbiontica]
MGQVDPSVKLLLDAYPAVLTLKDDGRVECILNGHTMPGRPDVVKAFVEGKKFQKLISKHKVERTLKQYEPFLTPSINFPGKLFCALTNHLIEADVDAVKVHLRGKRFTRAKDLFQADKLELFEEPDFAASPPESDEDAAGSGSEAEGKASSDVDSNGGGSASSSGLPHDMDIVLGESEEEGGGPQVKGDTLVEDVSVETGTISRKRRKSGAVQQKPGRRRVAIT